ncbi:MAG: DUF1080 domain-containing protein [Planctomycetaceae bacterium]
MQRATIFSRPLWQSVWAYGIVAIAACGCAPQAPAPAAPAASPPQPPPASVAAADAPSSATPAADRSSGGATTQEPPPAYFNPLTPEQIADGWASLFDGHTLFGWVANKPEVNWSVKDGVITADSGPIGLLNTYVPFADFELACEFEMEADGNSGVFLRTLADPSDVKKDCYELNIADAHPDGFTTGAIVGHAKTAAPIKGSGGWKKLHVRVEGNRFVVTLDGEQVLDYTDETRARSSGLIGLQKNKGKVAFRNIVLKPLSLTDLFNGADTAGWRVVPGSKSEFAVDDGTIHLQNGPGFLETEQQYGDFVFQCDAQTHGDKLNSGFFFRAMPGTEQRRQTATKCRSTMALREMTGPNRRIPERARSSGARQRGVVSSDHEWCTITLVADGNRFMTWVNGYPVTDWTDDRKPDENPRKGRRDAAGHISLQGHDATTDISFRRLKIAELPAE